MTNYNKNNLFYDEIVVLIYIIITIYGPSYSSIWVPPRGGRFAPPVVAFYMGLMKSLYTVLQVERFGSHSRSTAVWCCWDHHFRWSGPWSSHRGFRSTECTPSCRFVRFLLIYMYIGYLIENTSWVTHHTALSIDQGLSYSMWPIYIYKLNELNNTVFKSLDFSSFKKLMELAF